MNNARSLTPAVAILAGLLTLALLLGDPLGAAERRASDIRSTKHNLSSSSSEDVRAQPSGSGGTEEVCVFCHTPHGASSNPGQPLWNRSDSNANYTLYDSSSLQASASMAQPSEQSKLCLSCHDGTLAIGAVGNAAGSGRGQTFSENGFSDIRIRMRHNAGSGETSVGGMAQVPNVAATNSVDSLSGFTRNLGVDLSNDHPISFPYTTALADADGELRDPAAAAHIESRGPGVRPIYPLTGDNMQCTTCHDPHVKGQDIPSGTSVAAGDNNSKFLRGPRFQISVPSGINFQQGVFDPNSGNAQSGDIVCLACHDRELDNRVWSTSVHANPNVADEAYLASASALRQFPSGIKVWQASCLNCHDTHSVTGSRRLLREGTDGSTNADGAKSGGSAALEETCYQCHTTGSSGASILDLTTGSGTVPNIKGEFNRTITMPLVTSDQRNASSRGGTGEEKHDISNADFAEQAANLGKNNDIARHAECTDCHNPHRMQRNSRFNLDNISDGATNSDLRTHQAGLNATTGGFNDGREGNVASGILRGTWGVDLDYPANGFQQSLSSFQSGIGSLFPERMTENDFVVRSGDPGSKTLAQADNDKHLTREYQLCFKCHSSYSQDYRTGGTDARSDTTLQLGDHGGGTAANATHNIMTHYTNVAGEFLSVRATNPATTGTDQGEFSNSGSACDTTGDGSANGDCTPTTANQTPVRAGSTSATNNHRSWHPVVYPTGRDAAERGRSSITNIRAPFADRLGTQTMYCSDCHGADGSWTEGTGPDLSQVQGPHGSDQSFLLKGKWDGTVKPGALSGSICGRCHNPPTTNSGFSGGSEANHNFSSKRNTYCMGCHVAVPHGWKNKALLANLNCVGPEAAGHTAECTSYSGTTQRTFAPYYNKAFLRIESFARSGSWQESNCGGTDWMSNACESGRNY